MADLLLSAAREATKIFFEGLSGEKPALDNDALPDGETSAAALMQSLLLEVLSFELHLTDRLAFSKFGSKERATFMDTLLAEVARRLEPPFNVELQDVFNIRQQFYGRFPKLYAEKGDSLAGTLFWEFGKAMAAVYADNNPAAVTTTSINSMTLFETVNGFLRMAKVI